MGKPERSIVAIYNGHITGRKVGDPATDLGRRLLEGDFPDRVVSYPNVSPKGGRLKSSSVAIRNSGGELIGVVGLNLDVSYFEQITRYVDHLTSTKASEYVSSAEQFRTAKQTIREAIDRYLLNKNWKARKLGSGEKQNITEFLYKNGYFENRGAATIVAEELGITRASVYNYLKRIRAESPNDHWGI